MPTPAQFRTTVAAAVAAAYAGLDTPVTAGEMANLYDTLHQPVPAGEALFQLRSYTLPQTKLKDAIINYRPAVTVVLECHYHLDDGFVDDWSPGGMQEILQTLTTPQWWQDLSGVNFVDDKPVGDRVTRVGNVVSFTVTATVTIDPP